MSSQVLDFTKRKHNLTPIKTAGYDNLRKLFFLQFTIGDYDFTGQLERFLANRLSI